MQDLEFLSICVGFFIICKSSNWEGKKSSSEPSKQVISFHYLSLKSPIMTLRKSYFFLFKNIYLNILDFISTTDSSYLAVKCVFFWKSSLLFKKFFSCLGVYKQTFCLQKCCISQKLIVITTWILWNIFYARASILPDFLVFISVSFKQNQQELTIVIKIHRKIHTMFSNFHNKKILEIDRLWQNQ